jgi:hypothetical protein
MDLPITEKDLDIIMKLLQHTNRQLYDKLWIYKFNKIKGDMK